MSRLANIASLLALSMYSPASKASVRSNFNVGPGKICNSILTLKVEVKELDTNGLWNHLLLSKPTAAVPCGGEDGVKNLVVSGEAHLSWSQVANPLPYEEGQTFRARIVASCEAGYGIYEIPGLNYLEASYRVWICNVDKVTLID